jgi:hypothetical protein
VRRSAAFDRHDTLHQVGPLIRDEKSESSGLGMRDDDRRTDPIEQRSARRLCHGLRPDPIPKRDSSPKIIAGVRP